MLSRDRQTSLEDDLRSKSFSAVSREGVKDASAFKLRYISAGGMKAVPMQMDPQPEAQTRRLQLARGLDSQEAFGVINPQDCWLGQTHALIKSCDGTPVNSSDESAVDATTCNQVHK